MIFPMGCPALTLSMWYSIYHFYRVRIKVSKMINNDKQIEKIETEINIRSVGPSFGLSKAHALVQYSVHTAATALWTNLASVSNGAINTLSPECCYSLKATVLWTLSHRWKADFLKTSAPLSLIKSFRMRPLLTRSILLDSTFKNMIFEYYPVYI